MRWLPRMRWRPRMRWWLPRMRWLSRLRGLQSLPMRRRLRWLRRWVRDRRAIGSMCRLLRILGPVPLVLGNDAC